MSQSSTRGARTESIAELIALGRDREAVDAATRESAHRSDVHRTDRGGAMDGVQQLDEIMPMLETVVARIQPDQLEAETPCTNFSVTGVLEHMIGGAGAFAPMFRGESPSSASAPKGSVQDRFRQAMAELSAAVHTDGAQERTIAAPIGEVPGAVFARFVAFDGLVHGWDLAVATGQAYAPRDELVAEVDAFARDALRPEMRDGETWADATRAPEEASPIERLAAFTGRSLPT